MPGCFDLVECIGGKDWFLSDYQRVPSWRNEEIQKTVSELQKLMPDAQWRTIRFITPEFEELFSLKDGESLLCRYMDGTTKNIPCYACFDDNHFYLGGRKLFHICQFAEISRANGTLYVPANPQADRPGTYEIYQLNRYGDADYRFADYKYAKDKIKVTDYRHAYSGMLAEDTTLDDLYMLHNSDDRPFARQMTSLSMSDIIITEKKGKRTAYYVDSFGFTKLSPRFERQLSKVRKIKRIEPER